MGGTAIHHAFVHCRESVSSCESSEFDGLSTPPLNLFHIMILHLCWCNFRCLHWIRCQLLHRLLNHLLLGYRSPLSHLLTHTTSYKSYLLFLACRLSAPSSHDSTSVDEVRSRTLGPMDLDRDTINLESTNQPPHAHI